MELTSMRTSSNHRFRSTRVSSHLLTKALCQYYVEALIIPSAELATSLSDAQYRKNVEVCAAEVDAIHSRCVAEQPEFGLSREDFRSAINAAADKYLVGVARPEESPSVDEIREFIGELQHSDLYLALACTSGNEIAWQFFDREYRSFIERLARHLARSGSDADEVIDSVYAELFGTRVIDGVRHSKFKSYTGRGSLRGWLRAVVANAVIDLYRERQAEVSLDEWSESGGEARMTPSLNYASRAEDLMLANVERERYRSVTLSALDQALGSLDHHEKLLLLYYHVDGLKLREIARIVEEPRSPIRRWFQRRAKRGRQTESKRVHESTVMRWLEKAYRKVLDHFQTELGNKHGLSAAEIEICQEIATEDLGHGVNLKIGKEEDAKAPVERAS
jgi:RNA polymerase sigma-70 factor